MSLPHIFLPSIIYYYINIICFFPSLFDPLFLSSLKRELDPPMHNYTHMHIHICMYMYNVHVMHIHTGRTSKARHLA